MSFNRPDPMVAGNRHLAIGFKGRPVRIQDAVYSRLVKMAEDEDDCNYARCLLQQVCEIFRDEVDAQKTAEPLTKSERKYLAGWEDALETVCGLASLCLRDPLDDEDLSRPGPPALSSNDYSKRSNQGGFANKCDELFEGLVRRRHEEYGRSFCGDTTSPMSSDNRQENSCSPTSQASDTPIKTPSTVSISDSVLQALFSPSPSNPGLSKPNRHGRDLNKSELIRGLDTTALLTHFERQSRLSERRIAAELGRTSILRQAIFQDRFFGRVPSFAGTPASNNKLLDGEDYDAPDATNEINDPFLGEAQQDRSVKQVKTLFRQWRKAAAEGRIEDESLDKGIRTAKQDNNVLLDDSKIPCHKPESWLSGHGGDAPVPSSGLESVYSNEAGWPTATSEPCDDALPLTASRTQRPYHLMTNAPIFPYTYRSYHGRGFRDEGASGRK
ncbi:hypothetical protein CI238_03602 [Colletotrichum incanum]|uniref:Uncharacterized protein n=1 Tax=Colletotrichum incanum TaxID=1573173 RepID=A0A167DXL0_COLIC|nr:hypothetical protein CI238_03602 [Colletotrichum incanum]